MNAVLHTIKLRIADILGLDRMGKAYHVLVTNYVFLMFYTTLESVFVNTLLYRISGGSMASIIIYRGITYVSSAVFFHVGALISHKKTPVICARTGALAYLIMYVILFAGMERMETLQYIVAVMAGAGGGMYWTGHNTLVTHYTTKDNRDVGIAALGVVQGVLTLSIPVISGFVISLMPETSGYRVMFGVAMLAVLTQLYVMSKFYPVKQKKHKSEMKLAIKFVVKKLSYKLMFAYEFIRGMREGTFAFIMNMLLFEIITDESIVGINTFFTGIMAIAGSWAYGRLVRPRTRVRYSVVGVTALMLVCAVLFFNMSVPAVMIFTIVNAFMQLLFMYSYGNTTFDVIAQSKAANKCSSEMFAFRETAIMFGRLLGLWVTMIVPPTQSGYVRVMLILTVMQYVAVWLMKLTTDALEAGRSAQGRKKNRKAARAAEGV